LALTLAMAMLATPRSAARLVRLLLVAARPAAIASHSTLLLAAALSLGII
jgi:hypothetical protein